MRVSQMGQERLEASRALPGAVPAYLAAAGGSWLHKPAAKGSGESLEGHHSRGQVYISDCSLGRP